MHPSPGARAVETAHSGDRWAGPALDGLTTTPVKSDGAGGSAGGRLSRGADSVRESCGAAVKPAQPAAQAGSGPGRPATGRG